ncbi:MAG: hypothetical protein VX641_00280 [Planctomycetota bacterium]|nr:hypothetical protein [Planctomycetota bacterium]
MAARFGVHDKARPPLRNHPDGSPLSPLEESRLLRAERSTTYRALADHVVDSEAPLEQVVRALQAFAL